MTHNLLYRIPDDIYQKFFCTKVVLNRLPPQAYEKPAFSESDSSSDESAPIENSYEYYLENNYRLSENSSSSSVDGIMITRSAWKKINRGLPADSQLQSLAPTIPKIIIKKKSKKVDNKIKLAAEPARVMVRSRKKRGKKSPVNYDEMSTKPIRGSSRLALKKPASKPQAPAIERQFESLEEIGKTSPCESTTNCEHQSAKLSTRTVETGYSSAADSTTNEPLDKSVQDFSKPILNYTIIPKPKRGRHSKTCCLDFVIMPPTEPITPSKMVPITSVPRGKPRGRPRCIFGEIKPRKPKTKPIIDGVVKKPRKKYEKKNKLVVPDPPPILPKPIVVPGRSLPILEGPPNIARAAWIKEQLMTEDFMCRIPLSKISRIPRVLKIQLPPIVTHPKNEKSKINYDQPVNALVPDPEPEPDKIEPASIIEMPASDVTKRVTIEAINDWFPHDLDLSSLNETNYNETDMVLEDQYFPKEKSFSSTPCPDQPSQAIESYMTEKLATETLPDISFGSTFFNYTETADVLVTPVKQPLSAPERFPEGDDDRYIPVTALDFETKPEVLDFSFKRPFNKPLFQIPESLHKNYICSPASEPLDLSVRTGFSLNLPISCTQSKYAPSLSPHDDVLLLDASYVGIDSTPRCDSSERTENHTSPFDQRTGNSKIMDNFLSDVEMNAMVREQDRLVLNNSQPTPRDQSTPILFQSQEDAQKSKIFSELNKITRSIHKNNESETLSQQDNIRDARTLAAVERLEPLQYNGNFNFDEITLKRRVLKIFGFPCFRFLSGKCITFPCKYNHKLIKSRMLESMLTSEPICVIEKCYALANQYDILFIQYFESFCILFGKCQMIQTLISTIRHCEKVDRPIGFYRHIITGLVICKLDNTACYATLVKNVGSISFRSIDVLIEIMLELDVVSKFTDKLEEFLKMDWYRVNVDLFDRLLSVGKRTKNPELIRILLETINSYPSDCQKRLNSTVLTQFLQMVRNFGSLQD